MDELWDKFHASRSVADRNLLVEHYMYLVPRIASSLPSHLPMDELVSAGYEGLIDAVERYESGRSSFETYAYARIRGAILDYARKQDFLTRTNRDRLRERQRAEQETDGSDQAMAEELGVSVDSYVAQYKGIQDPKFYPIDEDRDFELPNVDRFELWDSVKDLLSEQDYEIIVGLYLEGRSVTEVARILGIPQSVVFLGEAHALSVLRKHLA